MLVHYLNVPNVEDSGKACGPVLCAVTDRRDGLRWSREELLSQLKPMCKSPITAQNHDRLTSPYVTVCVCV